jgi:hypothetical protein
LNVLKRLTEITELTKSELTREAGLEGRIYNLFDIEIPEHNQLLLTRVMKELEVIYKGRKFSRIVFDAIKRKVENAVF